MTLAPASTDSSSCNSCFIFTCYNGLVTHGHLRPAGQEEREREAAHRSGSAARGPARGRGPRGGPRRGGGLWGAAPPETRHNSPNRVCSSEKSKPQSS